MRGGKSVGVGGFRFKVGASAGRWPLPPASAALPPAPLVVNKSRSVTRVISLLTLLHYYVEQLPTQYSTTLIR